MFCSSIFNYRNIGFSDHVFHKRLFKRSSIFCGIASVEASLNFLFSSSSKSKEAGLSFDSPKNRSIHKKIEIVSSWSKELEIERLWKIDFSDFVDIRNETAHPKRRDHGVQDFIDEVDLSIFIRSMKLLTAKLFLAADVEYPYWVHGWNYMNPIHSSKITLINNTNFLCSLAALGFSFRAGYAPGTLQANSLYCRSVAAYELIEKFLSGEGALVEYVDPSLWTKPLLMRDWHDPKAIAEIMAQLAPSASSK